MSNKPILVVGEHVSSNAKVISDYFFAFQKYSSFPVHTAYHGSWLNYIDLSKYSTVVIFWSIHIHGVSSFDHSLRAKIRSSSAKKILFIQDEYQNLSTLHSFINETGIADIVTCISDVFTANKVYPAKSLPLVKRRINAFTGYITRSLLWDSLFRYKKTRLLGYRARELPLYLGYQGLIKTRLANRAEALAQHEPKIDVSARECDRLYGRQWEKFLQSCSFTLGSESGSSFVDPDGSLRLYASELAKLNISDDLKLELLSKADTLKVSILALSPRLFESIAYGACPVLVCSTYNSVFHANKHYIPLKPDLSDLTSTLGSLSSTHGQTVVNRAKRDILYNPRYTYWAAIRGFDALVQTYDIPTNGDLLPSLHDLGRPRPHHLILHPLRRIRQFLGQYKFQISIASSVRKSYSAVLPDTDLVQGFPFILPIPSKSAFKLFFVTIVSFLISARSVLSLQPFNSDLVVFTRVMSYALSRPTFLYSAILSWKQISFSLLRGRNVYASLVGLLLLDLLLDYHHQPQNPSQTRTLPYLNINDTSLGICCHVRNKSLSFIPIVHDWDNPVAPAPLAIDDLITVDVSDLVSSSIILAIPTSHAHWYSYTFSDLRSTNYFFADNTLSRCLFRTLLRLRSTQ